MTDIDSKFGHLKPFNTLWADGEYERAMAPYIEVFGNAVLHDLIRGNANHMELPPIFWGYCGDTDDAIDQSSVDYMDGILVTWFNGGSDTS